MRTCCQEAYATGINETVNALMNQCEREERKGIVVFSKHDLEIICCNLMNRKGMIAELTGNVSHPWD